MDNLRQYQIEAIDGVMQNKRNLIHLDTGSGKSVIFKHIILHALKNGQKVLFLVARQNVITQAYEKHFGDIQNKSLMMGANKYELSDLLCASIDTLTRRKHVHDEIVNKYDLIIVDECHDCTANKYTSFLDLIPQDKTCIGFSATPYRVGKKAHTFWDLVIHPINTLDLIKQGHLVFPEIYSAEIKMKSDVKTIGGDFNNKDLFKQNDSMAVYGDIIKEYKKYGKNKKAFCFAINIEHSKKIAEEFSKNNIYAVHVDSNDPPEYRSEVLWEFENGLIQILCNVNIFSTGTDIPCAEVGIMARPTKSLILWKQQIGRLLRPYKDKKSAIILDHGGNTFRLGHPINDFPAEIDQDQLKKPTEISMKVYQCGSCFYVFGLNTNVCPQCGAKNEIKIRLIKEEKEKQLKKFDLNEKKKKEKSEDDEYEKVRRVYFKPSRESEPLFLLRDRIFDNAKAYKYKKWSILFKTYELEKERNAIGLTIKYPKWFLDIQSKNEQLPPASESNSEDFTYPPK